METCPYVFGRAWKPAPTDCFLWAWDCGSGPQWRDGMVGV